MPGVTAMASHFVQQFRSNRQFKKCAIDCSDVAAYQFNNEATAICPLQPQGEMFIPRSD